jgi:hypothetical protein
VHVCQRWRYLVFESPIRLSLQLYCTEKTPVRKLLYVWPSSLPFTIRFHHHQPVVDGFDNIVAALKHCNRVRQIHITNTVDHSWGEIVTEMQGPFPALRYLWLDSIREMLTLPDSFLNGPAPCLQDLTLRAISFPSLSRLLLSTGGLISLRLFDIPTSGYISPVTMATCLSALPKLESLSIDFKSPTPHPQPRDRPVPPPTQFVLPALTELGFQGVIEYFEILTGCIDAPLLDYSNTTFKSFHQPELFFDIPQTIRFFNNLRWPRPSSLALRFNSPYDASLLFSPNTTPHARYYQTRSWNIIGRLDRQVSSVAYICSQILHFRSSVESLRIQCSAHLDPEWILQDEINSTLWSQLFHSFTFVHNLDISVRLEPYIAAAL